MHEPINNASLVLDLLEWIAAKPRSYRETMAIWGSTCPNLTVWEDAIDARLIGVDGRTVTVTAVGSAFVKQLRM